MKITDSQNLSIRRIFPNYKREKSYIICESGNHIDKGYDGTFTAHIWYKGDYSFICENGNVTSYKKL